jgi:allantoate deiminase
MLFVRCRDGVSHHPDEHVEPEDVEAGARVLLAFIENFQPQTER